MRKTALLIIFVATLFSVVACQAEVREAGGGDQGDGGGQNGPIRLAVVPQAVGFEYWTFLREGAECAVSEHEEVSMQWDGVTQQTDVNGQVNLLQNFITQGVDGLVYSPSDARVLADVSQQALDQGLTVVNVDTRTDPQPEEAPVFATDNVAAARQVPDLLAEELGPDGGKIAFLPFQPGSSTNDARTRGFKEALEDHPELELVAEQSSQNDFTTALRVTEDILTANPDLDAIFAANESSTVGAAEAVQQAGKAGDIVIVGWDVSPDLLQGIRDGVISAIVVQNPFKMGYDGVDAAVRIIREGASVESEDTGSTIVTRENLSDPEVQAVLNPSCEDPPD
ncbi:MAG: ABC transporter substrate-binding protein [Rubrobacteraceae bacterium]